MNDQSEELACFTTLTIEELEGIFLNAGLIDDGFQLKRIEVLEDGCILCSEKHG